jgi:hypothetical protein
LGFGRGRRFGGRGFWQGRWQTVGSVTDEKTQLVSEREWLSQQLDLINQRLSKIEDKE